MFSKLITKRSIWCHQAVHNYQFHSQIKPQENDSTLKALFGLNQTFVPTANYYEVLGVKETLSHVEIE